MKVRISISGSDDSGNSESGALTAQSFSQRFSGAVRNWLEAEGVNYFPMGEFTGTFIAEIHVVRGFDGKLSEASVIVTEPVGQTDLQLSKQ